MTPSATQTRLIWNIAPSLNALIENGPDSYKFDIASSTSFHNKDTTDNFTQVNLGAGVHKEFTSQHRLDITGDADWLYEPRGGGLTEGQGSALDELVNYQQQNLTARYEYGAQSSKAMLAITAGYYNKITKTLRPYPNFVITTNQCSQLLVTIIPKLVPVPFRG